MSKVTQITVISDKLGEMYRNEKDVVKSSHIYKMDRHLKASDSYLIKFALNNLINTYGVEAVKAITKRELGLINSKRKAA